jgi:hypothetical protein
MPKLSQEYHLCLENLHQADDTNFMNEFEFQPQDINLKPNKGRKINKCQLFFSLSIQSIMNILFVDPFQSLSRVLMTFNQEMLCLIIIEFLTRQSQCKINHR